MLVGTIALGLSTRRFPNVFPAIVAQYGGDSLWAAMMFWVVALVRPSTARSRIAMVALSISFAVECSQLYRAPWIDSLRATKLGALVLGQGFLWSDLACYAVGVMLAAVVDTWLVGRSGAH